MVTVYGIPNCDTVKKAKKWLTDQGHEFQFHDFRKDGLSASQVKAWAATISMDILVNKRSTTWKQLSDAEKAAFGEQNITEPAIELLTAHPTLIKRPVLEAGAEVHVGFKPDQYQNIFN